MSTHKNESKSQSATQPPKLYRIREVAEMFKKSDRTIRRLIDDRLIGHIRIGKSILISADQINHYLASREFPALSEIQIEIENF